MNRNTLKDRKFIVYGFFLVAGILLLAKLFYIQVVDDSYKEKATRNAYRAVTIYPERGAIFDRNGKLLVANERAYDLMLTPNEMEPMDTAKLCAILKISKAGFKKRLAKVKNYSNYKASLFLHDLSKESGAKLKELSFLFKGFYLQERTLRSYPYHSAANVLGYISQVPDRVLEKDPYYQEGDNIGLIGVEYSYEKYLRGERGVKYIMRDVLNNEKGSYDDGRYDTLAVQGKDIGITIDADLQAYGELLMRNKVGSIVAIEPATGELLALVSSPSYDPAELVGRKRSANYSRLYSDTLKPLFDRSVLAGYPPGSTFKLVNALIGLQEGVLNSGTTHPCSKGYRYSSKLKIGCHRHDSPLNLNQSISQSCNAYYCLAFQDIINKYSTTVEGYNNWRKHVTSFGLGNFLNNDLATGTSGLVPKSSYYDKVYGKRGWKAPTVLSLAIGQDALTVTPIQIANMCAAIANKGYYYTPHIVKEIDHKPITEERFITKKMTTIDTKHFDLVIDGMQQVVEGDHGTGGNAAVDGIVVCGKTGTAENSREDHSVFIAFAPRENPKIALAVYVENAGWGSSFASPIAGLMIEKYLNGVISESKKKLEKKMIESDLIHKTIEKK